MDIYPVEIDLSLDGREPRETLRLTERSTFYVFFKNAHDADLAPELTALLDDAGIAFKTLRAAHMTLPGADLASLPRDAIEILGAVGGLGGIAAVLKTFFGRHKDKIVKFGKDGEILQADGLGTDEIIRLLNALNRNSHSRPMAQTEIPEETTENVADRYQSARLTARIRNAPVLIREALRLPGSKVKNSETPGRNGPEHQEAGRPSGEGTR